MCRVPKRLRMFATGCGREQKEHRRELRVIRGVLDREIGG
jgi:hypothetical protein